MRASEEIHVATIVLVKDLEGARIGPHPHLSEFLAEKKITFGDEAT